AFPVRVHETHWAEGRFAGDSAAGGRGWRSDGRAGSGRQRSKRHAPCGGSEERKQAKNRGPAGQKTKKFEGNAGPTADSGNAVYVGVARRRLRVLPRREGVGQGRQEDEGLRAAHDGDDVQYQQGEFRQPALGNLLLVPPGFATSAEHSGYHGEREAAGEDGGRRRDSVGDRLSGAGKTAGRVLGSGRGSR